MINKKLKNSPFNTNKYTFHDLQFETHVISIYAEMGAKQAKLTLENGMIVSVVGGCNGLYGDGINSFEVAIWNTDTPDNLWPNNDVHPYLTKEGVVELINKVVEI